MCLAVAFMAGCTKNEPQIEVSTVSLNTATIEMTEGDTYNLIATVLPKNAEFDGVKWASSNVSVASVSNGTVTGLKSGTSTITASAGGKSATCSVTVFPRIVDAASVTLDKTSLSMKAGDTETLTATVDPADATDQTITWSSSDDSIVTVSDGKLTAKDSGTATITAKVGNCTAECTVTVTVDSEAVSLDITSLALTVGESAVLTSTVKPENATDKNVVWTSSDENVATVSDGKVTAIGAGSATIKAACGGKSAECAVTVTVPVNSIALDMSDLLLTAGESTTLTATVKPENATDKNVVWTSSDESVATVADGKVTAIGAGSATIKAACGGLTAECNVVVLAKVTGVELKKSSVLLMTGDRTELLAHIIPDNAANRSIKWSSDNMAVATVNNGEVTAISEGTATITVTTEEGQFTASCTVTVSDDITKYVSAYYAGGSMSIINGLIQYGSCLNFGVSNNSTKAITVKSVQLIDGLTGSEGNVMTIGHRLEGGVDASWSINIGLAGIHAPIAKFVYEYAGTEYTTQAEYREFKF